MKIKNFDRKQKFCLYQKGKKITYVAREKRKTPQVTIKYPVGTYNQPVKTLLIFYVLPNNLDQFWTAKPNENEKWWEKIIFSSTLFRKTRKKRGIIKAPIDPLQKISKRSGRRKINISQRPASEIFKKSKKGAEPNNLINIIQNAAINAKATE